VRASAKATTSARTGRGGSEDGRHGCASAGPAWDDRLVLTPPPAGQRARREAGRADLDLRAVDAVLFDLDGVITDTASVHAEAWKQVFDAFLQARRGESEAQAAPFDRDLDYRRHVDGKPRYDGVRAFLASRGMSLPEGTPEDPPERETVHGLGNRKDAAFRRYLEERGGAAFESSVSLVHELRRRGLATAVFSSSRNCVPVLRAAGLLELFDARVDGLDADERGLPGKPDPAVLLEAARELGVRPGRAAVVEDALAGVEAARRGGFAAVVGVDRAGHGQELLDAGADVVVGDLSELRLEPPERGAR
jgi:alpha,alpha-trehalase